MIPYSTYSFPTALLQAGSEHIHDEYKAYIVVNNTFHIILNGHGIQPGGVFSPTALRPHPTEGWITRLCVHLHVDLNGLFVTPGRTRAASSKNEVNNGLALIAGVGALLTRMYQNGMTCLATVELAIVEVIPEQLRIHEMCRINERDVRARYRAVVEPLLKGVKRGVVVRLRGVECVYVPQVVEHVGQAGEEWGGEDEESDEEEGDEEFAGGRERRQGSEQARVLAQEGGGWERGEDYEFLLMETMEEIGKRERGRCFVDDRGEGEDEGPGYGAEELFGPMLRASQLPTCDEQGQDEEEEEVEEEAGQGGLTVPKQRKRRGLTRLVSHSRLALRLSTAEKQSEKEKNKEEERASKEAEKLQEKEAKERQKEKEKLEKEREKQRAKAKKEQDKKEKKAEKRKPEGNKGVESQEQVEGRKDKIKWFGHQKKDGDEKEPRNATW